MPVFSYQGRNLDGTAATGQVDAPNEEAAAESLINNCLLYTSPSPRDLAVSRMPSSA